MASDLLTAHLLKEKRIPRPFCDVVHSCAHARAHVPHTSSQAADGKERARLDSAASPWKHVVSPRRSVSPALRYGPPYPV